jgi:hypothetical protein
VTWEACGATWNDAEEAERLTSQSKAARNQPRDPYSMRLLLRYTTPPPNVPHKAPEGFY